MINLYSKNRVVLLRSIIFLFLKLTDETIFTLKYLQKFVSFKYKLKQSLLLIAILSIVNC